MTRVIEGHAPTPNDVTKVSQTFHNLIVLRASLRVIRRQATTVTPWGTA
jgi:hypothetical protein